ncbi:MAG: FAD-dependent oxidoreductase [Deltaproteobacteria bacterium]|nr:FAD-dependent oxidoreductase [Deltaproteobacteria bacterium]
MNLEYDLIVIGGGPAGLTAGLYAARAGLKTLILEKAIVGGQTRLTVGIENYPGFPFVKGADLAEAFHEQALKQGAEIKIENVVSLASEGDFKIIVASQETYRAKAAIIASGSRLVNLNVPGADEFVGRGVSFCALCDAGFVRGEPVAVVGGGNSALEEAHYLTRFASKVYLIHRRDEFRADRRVQEKALADPKIEFLLSSDLTSVMGTDIVEKITVKSRKTQDVLELKVAGVFMFVGAAPNVEFLPPEIERLPGGWIRSDAKLETSIKGVFAAGDVRDTDLRQVVTATADGARAGVNASHYIESLKKS